MPRYMSDPILEAVARPLIRDYHPDLKIIKIAYLFREEGAMSEDRVVAGMAVRVDDRNWSIHKTDAIIEIAKDVWENASTEFKIALMDHELSHLGIRMDEAGTPVMDEATMRIKVFLKHHDVEEFDAVLERHGAYHKALRSFLLAFAVTKADQKKAKKAGMTSGASNTD